MKRSWFVLALLVGMIAACSSPAEAPPQPTGEVLSGRVTFAGSTTVQPLADVLGRAFQERHPDVELEIAAGGSVVGIQAVHDGTADIGMASRALTAEEAAGIETHQIAVDVIAVVVHATNSVRNLTMEELRGIYLGEIVNWRQVGGEDLPIVVVMRGQNSGTRGAFDELVLGGAEPAALRAQIAVTAGDVVAIVADDPAAIGYVGFGNLEPGIAMIAIDGILPSEETARNGSYRLVRPLLLLTGPLTQPLARRFVDFALSDEGQQIVEESGWVPAH
jgi:phosphate transport system substrate-binding protein